MVKRRMGIILSLICFCLFWMLCPAQAASTTDAREPIDPETPCSLTINYCYEGTPFPDISVQLYHIANVSADFQYTFTANFANSGLILNGIQTNGEWNVIRSTLEAHILAYSITADRTATTNPEGQINLEGLKTGLYLVVSEQSADNDLRCHFSSALIALPGLGADGLWQYQIAVSPKAEILPPIEPDDEIQLKILKLWKGDEGHTDRPQRIDVEIFRNGESYRTVVLSEENNWSYSWSAKDDGATWMVVERNIPSKYTVTVEERGTTFVLTNTLNPDNPPPIRPPQTGDTANIMLYTLLLYLSGTILILLGITRKRSKA